MTFGSLPFNLTSSKPKKKLMTGDPHQQLRAGLFYDLQLTYKLRRDRDAVKQNE